MGILDRIKKQEYVGFKEFVSNLESTALGKRKEIMTLAMLEDPIYMKWVGMNLLTMEKFKEVGSDFFQSLVKKQESYIGVIARAIKGSPYEVFYLETLLPPNVMKMVKDELEYLKELKPEEQLGAQFTLFKEFRKMQELDETRDIPWRLPSKEIFMSKDPDITGVGEIKLDDGKVLARGHLESGVRQGQWVFYYEMGQILAEGEFIKGQKQGYWNFYYPDGKILFCGSFKDDSRSGNWSHYDSSGRKQEKNYG